MLWSGDDLARVVEEFWTGTPRCPNCQRVLSARLSSRSGGYELVLECLAGCNKIRLGNEHDPRWLSFHDWSEQEIFQIIRQHFRGDIPQCPNDGNEVFVYERELPGESVIVLSCSRCLRTSTEHYTS